jgi:hypothetical protein
MSNLAADKLSTEEPKTWAELCRRYPDQWVVVVGTEWGDDGHFDFSAARVVSHAPSRADAIAQSRPIVAECRSSGCFFTGRVRAPRLGFFVP